MFFLSSMLVVKNVSIQNLNYKIQTKIKLIFNTNSIKIVKS
jgi:hypothetical protein